MSEVRLIKPTAMNQGDLVDLLYMIVASIKGICAKLDDDAGVTDETYEALCYTALLNTIIEDTRGNRTGQGIAESSTITPTQIITPRGVSDKALVDLIYQIFNMIETLTEQLDGDDGVNDTDYEALCYTALLTKMVTNSRGNTLGNGNTFWFNHGGVDHRGHLVDLLYDFVDCIETLTEKLDADTSENGHVADTDYEALWFTATVLLKVENSMGNTVGNATNKG